MNQNVLRSAFTVVVFWWLCYATWGLLFGQASWVEAWHASLVMLILVSIGVIGGFAGVWTYIWSDKEVTKAMTQGDAVRGLGCNLGEVPLIAAEPAQAENLPALDKIPDVPGDFYAKWFEKYRQSHPHHAAMMEALLRIYEAKRSLPATHIAGGHGGRTLLEHSLLAGYFMDKLAHSWTYTGLRDRSGKRVVLKLRDASYKFNSDDPLIAIIGVAHDIGKIEAYIFDKKDPSKIIGIHHEHDLTGARMIARLPQAWDIPDVDRQAMFLAIAHYHHPMELPLSPDRRAIDDRTIALMELLIKTDFVTSRVESRGVEPSEKEYEESGAQQANAELTPETLYQAFVDIINEHGRINSPDPRFNVATLCAGDGFDKPMLMLKEDALRPALVKRLGLGSSHAGGDGRHQITIDLLERLDKEGVLYKTHDGVEFSAQNSLWNVDFMVRATSGATPEKKSGWSAVIIIDPKLFPKIEQMEPYWWYAIIQRGSMGAARAINKKKGGKGQNMDLAEAADAWKGPGEGAGKADSSGKSSVLTKPQKTGRSSGTESKSGASSSPAPLEADTVVVGQVAPPAAAPAKTHPAVKDSEPAEAATEQTQPGAQAMETASEAEAPAPANPLLADVWSDDPAAETAAEQAAPEGASPDEAASQVEHNDATAPAADQIEAEASAGPDVSLLLETKENGDGGKLNIAPIDVKRALNKLVHEAESNGLVLKEMAGRTIVSTGTLSRFAPDIDWEKARYKIEQMAKAQMLDLWVVPLQDDAGYAIAFARDQYRELQN